MLLRRGALWFWRSSVKFQGYTEQKIADFDPNWAFPDCNLSFNLPMALKWCIKLNIAEKRCPIVFQGHPSNFKVTRDKEIADFDLNREFPDCNSSLNSPMDYDEMMQKAWCCLEEVPYCFEGHPSNFKITRNKKSPILTRIGRFRTVT